MSSNNNNSNQPIVPSAREALNKFKMEAAQDLDVPTPYRMFLAQKSKILLKIVESAHHLN